MECSTLLDDCFVETKLMDRIKVFGCKGPSLSQPFLKIVWCNAVCTFKEYVKKSAAIDVTLGGVRSILSLPNYVALFVLITGVLRS